MIACLITICSRWRILPERLRVLDHFHVFFHIGSVTLWILVLVYFETSLAALSGYFKDGSTPAMQAGTQ